CLVGALAVGKTALIQQYVHSIFSDEYLSSVGVKISRKTVETDGQALNMLLWDLEGQDDYGGVNISYLKGASGFFLVADGTRGETLSVALTLRRTALELLGPDTPHLLLINKNDLEEGWEITDKVLASLQDSGVQVVRSSARTGFNVEYAFSALAKMMLEQPA
ncbi:MAG: GTP-binding protein, partial [Candidatus Adiutrix sp.]|nr:GTP-binding protein [Candidatus Adiutrix sp.]